MTCVIALHRAAARGHREEFLAEAKPAVFRQLQEPAHHGGMLVIAVGCQPHHLVFLAESVESDGLADRRVEKPQAVGHEHPVEHLYAGTLAACSHHACEVSRSVEGKPSRQAFERGAVVGARYVREMMFNQSRFKAGNCRIGPAGAGDLGFERLILQPAPLSMAKVCAKACQRSGRDISHFGPQVGPRLPGDGDMIDVSECESGIIENRTNCKRWKCGVMLHAAPKPLLGHGHREQPVHE